MAAARMMMLREGRVYRSILAGVTPKGSCSGCLANSKQLWAPESAQHAFTSIRFFSNFWARPFLLGDQHVNVRKEFSCVRRMTSIFGTTSQADIIERVKHDYEQLEDYYSKYKAHQNGFEELADKWFNQFVWEVSRHAVSEELVLYPLIAKQGARGKELADQSRVDHQKVKNILADLQNTLDPDAFDSKMDKMMTELREHIKKEETEDLVYLRVHVRSSRREAAGATFHLGKNLTPTRPHPRVPNKPAALEAALGLLLAPADKLRDIFTPFPSKP